MRRTFVLPLSVAFGGLIAHSASATPIDAGTVLKDFNAVIYNNASTQSDIEGAAVVGGNLSAATIYNNPTASQPAGYGAMTVYGNTTGNSINLNNAGKAYVGGTKGAQVNFNGGGSYIGAPASTISDFETSLNALSLSLSQLASTSTLPTSGNNEVIKATPGANGIAVFNITASELDLIPSYQMNLNGATTVIFNVSGPTVSFNGNDESGVTGANSIIWNFYQATTVSLGTQIAGSILATGATVSNNNQIDGTLVAASWTGNGELHSYSFTGTLPTTVISSNASPVPEPASLVLFGTGLAMLRAIRKKRA